MPGIWQFQIRSGGVVCPGAGAACTVAGTGGACAMGRMNCVGAGTECVQQVFPEDERCDSVDNDCDGMPDDGTNEALCGAGYACRDGACVEDCFESSCPVGLSCATSGVCVEAGCETVDCEDGERCRAGACVDACDGVSCPFGQSCTEGRCVNPCLGLTCDDCSVCDAGTCEPRCTMGGTCGTGEVCDTATGGCVATGCAGVTCAAGTHCAGGSCVDSCTGVTCPPGQACSAGSCRSIPRPDAGVPVDAGPLFVDTGVGPGIDAGPGFDGGVPALDAGRAPPVPMTRGCNCRSGASSGSAGLGLGLLGLALLLVRRSKR
jgi:MYXO-CTERM domain-containing protein